MVEILKDKKRFKKNNIESWQNNASFVIKNGFPHIKLERLLEKEISVLVNKFSNLNSVLDIGCGTGWLKELLEENQIKLDYRGIDNCDIFIKKRSINYPKNFFKFDIEEKHKTESIRNFKSDILVCCLSLIETPHLKKSFSNLSKLCSENGFLMIVSLNPIIELYRVSNSFKEFEDLVEVYRNGNTLSISKRIKSKGQVSKSDYHRILYGATDFIEKANHAGFSLVNFIDDFNRDDLKKQPIYQFLLFKKE